ncbi:AAA family ATPase [Paenibacillus andongensis]|uniref:AAA family ATPase n=1 Tax=Paenibacillus andongensis TaxID=2975482 RepID=UPI0021BB1A8F|nr:AAA family ATPase [Paenibacillus andongensis]
MILNFIWIDQFKGIKEQGLNLNSQIKIDFDKVRGNLNITNNTLYIPNFFSVNNLENSRYSQLAKIENICAIVGENGTGKTTILDYIKMIFSSEYYNTKGILVLEFLFDNELRKCIFHHKDIQIKSGNYKEYGFNLYTYEQARELFSFIEKDTSIIYFSNIFDSKREVEGGCLINLSTNYLLINQNGFSDNVTLYRTKEIEWQVNFFVRAGSLLRSKVPFNAPDFLTINFIDSGWYKENTLFNISREPLIPQLFSKFVDNLNNDFNLEQFPKQLAFATLRHIYVELIRSDLEEKLHNVLAEAAKNFKPGPSRNNAEIVFDFLKSFENHLGSLHKQYRSTETETKKLLSLIQGLNKFIYSILKAHKSGEISIDRNGSVKIALKEAILADLLRNYGKSVSVDEYLTFDWRELSSGQKAYLTIFSRFYNIINRRGNILGGNVLILLDEAEVYLHPQWQKELLRNIIDFFSIAFRKRNSNKQKRLQIIMTSNSPFIVSDLPNTNIIFLKDNNGETVVSYGLDELPQTFASNINGLLAHTFFLKDGVIGSFAKDKINEIIHLLINGTDAEIKIKKNFIDKSIRIIGEPLIKNKLFQMLEERMVIDLMGIRGEINSLEKDLALIQERLKKIEGNQ